VTPGIFKKFYSTYHAKWVELDAPARLLVPYQHYLFYPVMSLARFNLYVQVRVGLLAIFFFVLFSRSSISCILIHVDVIISRAV